MSKRKKRFWSFDFERFGSPTCFHLRSLNQGSFIPSTKPTKPSNPSKGREGTLAACVSVACHVESVEHGCTHQADPWHLWSAKHISSPKFSTGKWSDEKLQQKAPGEPAVDNIESKLDDGWIGTCTLEFFQLDLCWFHFNSFHIEPAWRPQLWTAIGNRKLSLRHVSSKPSQDIWKGNSNGNSTLESDMILVILFLLFTPHQKNHTAQLIRLKSV